MTSYWTFISNELMQVYPCPIGTQRNFFNQAAFDPQTFLKMAVILRYSKVCFGCT